MNPAILSGILGNNRFLCRTNPTMAAAVADGGSVLDREYIQRCARQMIDLGIWGNLGAWWDTSLTKIRNSGGVDYISKGYDLTQNNYNIIQETETYQPILSENSFLFNGGRQGLIDGDNLDGLTELTVTFYIKLNTVADGGTDPTSIMLFVAKTADTATSLGNTDWTIYYDRRTAHQFVQFAIVKNSTTFSANTINISEFSTTTYKFVVFRWKASITTQSVYINEVLKSTKNTAVDAMSTTTQTLKLGGVATSTIRTLDGYIGDIRIFTKYLSTAQTTAIFNATKTRYGF